VLIEYERGRIDLETRIAGRRQEEFYLSVITASELLHGVHRAVIPACGLDVPRLWKQSWRVSRCSLSISQRRASTRSFGPSSHQPDR
jgi:predicted nucleic acid-binding protein